MINRVTGEISFQSGLHIIPHCSVQSLGVKAKTSPLVTAKKPSITGWKRHVLGSHVSEHGTFEVEALSVDDDRIQAVLMSHQHDFYEPDTPGDAERRVFHEGIIHADLAGQREFSWGEVLSRLETCRLEIIPHKDWLVVAYSRDAKVPLPDRDILLRLRVQEKMPDENM